MTWSDLLTWSNDRLKINKVSYIFINCIYIHLFSISFLYSKIWLFSVPLKHNWNKNLTSWMFTVQSTREATGLKWDVAWSPEYNMDLRCPDTPLIRLGTLARLGLCSAGAQLLLAPFWASGIDGFKLVLWQLMNTCPSLCGLPWSILFNQTFHTAQNFSPDKINHSLLWAP